MAVLQVLKLEALDLLLSALGERGYTLIGPTVRDDAIVYDEIESSNDLPKGYGDEQGPGAYRLTKRGDNALFGYVVGPQSWKKFLFPPKVTLWHARRKGDRLDFHADEEPSPKYAFIGARPCELHAIAVQDRVFLGGEYVDPGYKRRRENTFVVAVNCGCPAQTCFCTSMETGPKATTGYDIALTEIIDGDRHYFTVESGSQSGEELLEEIPRQPAADGDASAAQAVTERAASMIQRTMDTTGIKDLLYRNRENPRWAETAKRCLACANCTLVCPTCFCTTVEDTTDLAGETAERRRIWDSCFTMEFSYIHGGSIRASSKARYRQWLSHKLGTWIDQFGTSGCVGCGRCIAWCPVGIDITEEIHVLRESELKEATREALVLEKRGEPCRK